MKYMVVLLLLGNGFGLLLSGCGESPAKSKDTLTVEQAAAKILEDPRIQKYSTYIKKASGGDGRVVIIEHGEETRGKKTYYTFQFAENQPTHVTTIVHLLVDKQTGAIFIEDSLTDKLQPFDDWWEKHYGDFNFDAPVK